MFEHSKQNETDEEKLLKTIYADLKFEIFIKLNVILRSCDFFVTNFFQLLNTSPTKM